MIKSFAHKGLENFFFTGNTAGIQQKHSDKLKVILDWLNSATHPHDMNFPGSNLHQLKGNLHGIWSVKVSGNWRVTFRFQDEDVYVVDYIDYH